MSEDKGMDFARLFVYHAPNNRTEPLYAAVNTAEANAKAAIELVRALGLTDSMFTFVNETALAMANATRPAGTPVMDMHANAALERVVLYRNACNEALVKAREGSSEDVPRLLAMAKTYAQEFRWLANGGIALGDAAAASVGLFDTSASEG